jgi:glycine/D-amino acid oxidase-like deaminating enzyme
MIPNHSPWIKQLNRTRPVLPLDRSVAADVAIVGGGIAGVVTAFFTLRDTNKTVVLLEADKIAHGATGHNAGQVTSYFERPLTSLVDEFGLELAIDGQRGVESGWVLLDQIVLEAGLQTPLYRFTGYAGLSSLDQVTLYLKDNRCRVQGGLQPEAITIAEEWTERDQIPAEYADLYTVTPQQDLLALLETKNTEYIASLSNQKGCMNSALFVEELVGYLAATYKNSFSFYEGSAVRMVRLGATAATLEVGEHSVEAGRVVLCTNGFEHFTIKNEVGHGIDTTFHHAVDGRIGYMSGYVEPLNRAPVAISYFPKARERKGDPTGETYYYLTRRPHEHEGNTSYNLVCTGGPEKVLPNGATYSRAHECDENIREEIDDFVRTNYDKYPTEETDFSFCWHGLMGYTPNGVRRVGVEPVNPVLLYNLGCNGVGILPSVFGGKRIARLLRGELVGRSIFDPHDQSAHS